MTPIKAPTELTRFLDMGVKASSLSKMLAMVSAPNQPRITPTKVIPTWVVDRYSFKLCDMCRARLSFFTFPCPLAIMSSNWLGRTCTRANSAATKKEAKTKITPIASKLIQICVVITVIHLLLQLNYLPLFYHHLQSFFHKLH